MAMIYAVCCNKGGTGKTTTAINTAAALTGRGRKVLVIDFDGQANATDIMGIVPVKGGTIYDAMSGKGRTVRPMRVMNRGDKGGFLDILPSCPDLSALEGQLAGESDRVTRLRAVVDRFRDAYDYIIIDTTPLMGLLLISALYAADEVIITMCPEYLDLKGAKRLMDAIDEVNRYRRAILTYRILFTKADTRKGLHKTIMEQTAAMFPAYTTTIRGNVAISEAQAAQTVIFDYAPKSNGAADYMAFADELINQ